MLGLITISPGSNSYMVSLLEAYKNHNVDIICDKHNFFYSNIIPDFVHIHWPEMLYNWFPFMEKSTNEKLKIISDRLNWYKNNNAKIIFTVHNIEPHESLNKNFDNQLYNLIIFNSDILVHHCNESIEVMKKNYPVVSEKKHIVANHGDYLFDYIKIDKKKARELLGIGPDKFVILNFGQQRKNKGLTFTEKVFKELPINSKFLLTAGIYSFAGLSNVKKYQTLLINSIKNKVIFKRKKFVLRPIKQNEIPNFFSACDLVFLGHQSGLNSGIISMAATYSKPVIFPNIGCFASQAENWVSEKYRVADINDAVANTMVMYSKLLSHNEIFDNSKWLSSNNWMTHVEKILSCLRT